MAIFAIFLAKLLDPIMIIGAVLGGVIFVRRWWHALAFAIPLAVTQEFILAKTQYAHRFWPEHMILGIFAAFVWASAAYWVATKRRDRNTREFTAKREIEAALYLGAKTAREAAEITYGRPITEDQWEVYGHHWKRAWARYGLTSRSAALDS